ncbi:MAG TPA: hypothetical protein VFE16_04065 [Candidatus Cybelea sp.]|jgi:hypothetical protein|nr:hypothetical protein [Candidatus Cybelea sp.]
MLVAERLDAKRLLAMSRRQLIELYASSPAGPIPAGPAQGVALIAAGLPLSELFAQWTNLVGWQGKTFDAARGRLVNRITPFHLKAIAAEVYSAPSFLDGKPCIVLDYSKTSTLARFIRDEIRNVAPNLYLGFAYVGGMRTTGFGLTFGT